MTSSRIIERWNTQISNLSPTRDAPKLGSSFHPGLDVAAIKELNTVVYCLQLDVNR